MTPRVLTTVELAPSTRAKLDRLQETNSSRLMRVVISDAIDLLYASIHDDGKSYVDILAAIRYHYLREDHHE